MKLNIEELAKHAGYDVEDGAISMPVIQACGDPADERPQLKAFARLIVERCAQEAEALADKLLCVHDNEGALIALEARGNIRQLLED